MAEPLDIRSDVSVQEQHSKSLESFLKRFVDSEAFHGAMDGWLELKLAVNNDGKSSIPEPFRLDELCQFDYALEGLTFEPVMRMPSAINADSHSSTEACLALEDFLHTGAEGLWKTFWHEDDNDSFPFFVAGTHEIDRPNKGSQCAALVAKFDSKESHFPWEHILEFVMLDDNLGSTSFGNFPGLAQVSRAVFYALHLLLTRKIVHLKSAHPTIENAGTAYILLTDFQAGGVIKVKGDISELDTNTLQVYECAAVWVQEHAELAISTCEKVWNSFGSVNWKDIGALQLLLSTFCCMEQCKGLSKRSISDMAMQHTIRLLQRTEQQSLHLDGSSGSSTVIGSHRQTEIEEILDSSYTQVPEALKIEVGAVLWLEDPHGKRGFKVTGDFSDDRHFVYTAIAVDDEAKKPLNVYIGAHPTQLEPSWEDMVAWYQVQRQARVMTVMRERALSSKYIPEFVHSGELLHPEVCGKQTASGRCDHPWCGIPVLVTSPVGESLDKIFNRNGSLTPKELLECCHDCLSALQAAQSVGIQHANITPDHLLRVTEVDGPSYHVLIEWGHAILEEKDRPGMSLRFSSTDALQEGKVRPVSDIESLVYVLFYLSGGISPQFDSIESALQWRIRAWTRRAIQQVLGEASIVLKAFADYVDNLCGTPYAVDYGIWLSRLSRVIGRDNAGVSEQR